MALKKIYFSSILGSTNAARITETIFSPSESTTAVYKEFSSAVMKTLTWLAKMEGTIIGEWENSTEAIDVVLAVFPERVGRYYQEIKQIYNGLKTISMTPDEDTLTKEKKHEGMDGAMSENSPTDSSFDVNTPFVKSRGVNEYTDRETVSHNSVVEAVDRVRVLNEYRTRLHDIVKEGLYACCDQMITGW